MLHCFNIPMLIISFLGCRLDYLAHWATDWRCLVTLSSYCIAIIWQSKLQLVSTFCRFQNRNDRFEILYSDLFHGIVDTIRFLGIDNTPIVSNMGSYKRQVCAIPGNAMYKTINLHMLQVLPEIDFLLCIHFCFSTIIWSCWYCALFSFQSYLKLALVVKWCEALPLTASCLWPLRACHDGCVV